MELVGPSLEPEVIAAATRQVNAPVIGTAAVVQHAARPGRDGHFVVFDEPAVRMQYGCFFETAIRLGAPRVVAPGSGADDPCGL
jgi:hypothetical protein